MTVTPPHTLKETTRVPRKRHLRPDCFEVRPRDRELFDMHLASFVPPETFDVHAHWYDLDAVAAGEAGEPYVGYRQYFDAQRSWMGRLAPTDGLFFPMPTADLDTRRANRSLLNELQATPGSRGLAIVRPSDDAAETEELIKQHDLVGFKVYHLFADRRDTQQSTPDEYFSPWMWELAQKYGLVLMIHLVRDRSLADPGNIAYLRRHCLAYPNARVVLAHAGRGFCSRHTVEGVPQLRGLSNVYFDTSVVCEPAAFSAILECFGPRRLMFGSDFPLAQLRGRAVSAGDSYHWVYERDVPEHQRPVGGFTLVGLESLLAIRDACRQMHVNDSDVQRIFRDNAKDLLGLSALSGSSRSQSLYRHAEQVMPMGVQLLSKRPQLYAPDQWPPYYDEARGCELIDHDGRRLVDMTTTGIGACLLGFADPDVSAAVHRRVTLGSMSTLNCPDEVALADRLIAMHPWADAARFARTGGEALSMAARIARASTGRDHIAVCGYHGWSDWYLAANLSADAALDQHLLPGLEARGVPRGLTGTTHAFRYNQVDELEQIVKQHGKQLAAVVMEPTRSAPPADGFFAQIRGLCDECGARLVIDEVTTGFRLRSGGVHLDYGVDPDLAVFAKSLGNGHPIAAVIGRDETMRHAARSFISSTYWTEGVGYAAALATLDKFDRIDVPTHVERIGNRFREGLRALASRYHVPLTISGYPSLTYLGFDHADNMALTTLFTAQMLQRGYLAGASFYPSLAHQPEHVDAFLASAEPVFAELGEAAQRGDAADRIGGPIRQLPFARLA